MQLPLEITYRNVEAKENIDDLIREKAAKLERYCDHITSCRVAVEKRHEHQRSGQPFRVRIELNVPPGHKVIAQRESTEGELHTELATIIRNAFDAARRQLEKVSAQQRGEVKQHEHQEVNALVEKIFPNEDYGFLRTIDNRSIYFHRNSVLRGDFDRLKLGTGVRFMERPGENGPQASSIQIVDKPHKASAIPCGSFGCVSSSIAS